MDYNQLRIEWGKENAALRLVDQRFYYDDGFIATTMKKDLQGLSAAERAEYIEIVAAATGIVPLSDRANVLRSLSWSQERGLTGYLKPQEVKLFKKIFLESQEKQYQEQGRDRVADKLKSLNRQGMSAHNRKQYLMDAANEMFPMKEKGESMLKRALDRQAAEKKAKHRGGRKKKVESGR